MSGPSVSGERCTGVTDESGRIEGNSRIGDCVSTRVAGALKLGAAEVETDVEGPTTKVPGSIPTGTNDASWLLLTIGTVERLLPGLGLVSVLGVRRCSGVRSFDDTGTMDGFVAPGVVTVAGFVVGGTALELFPTSFDPTASTSSRRTKPSIGGSRGAVSVFVAAAVLFAVPRRACSWACASQPPKPIDKIASYTNEARLDGRTVWK
jgi:hypothetical protein